MRVLSQEELVAVSGGQSPLQVTGARVLEFNNTFGLSSAASSGFWGLDSSTINFDNLSNKSVFPMDPELYNWWDTLIENVKKFFGGDGKDGPSKTAAIIGVECAKAGKAVRYTGASVGGVFSTAYLECTAPQQ